MTIIIHGTAETKRLWRVLDELIKEGPASVAVLKVLIEEAIVAEILSDREGRKGP